MIGALGVAAAQGKLAVGFGAEAGSMDTFLQWMCRRYLLGFPDYHPQRGVPRGVRQAGCTYRTGNRYCLDL